MSDEAPMPEQPVDDPNADQRLIWMTIATMALVVVVVFGSRLLSSPTGQSVGPSLSLWVLIPVAYIAGVLALLSPCSGAMLPAFFSYSFESSGQLVRMTYVFYLGLALVFVPVSGASALVSSLVLDHADLVFAIGGGLLIAMGLIALFGFDLGRLTRPLGFIPSTVGQDQVQQARTQDGKVYLMGAVFGFATSSCTAPILGGLIALTISAGVSALAGVGLFLVFALGIATPLFVLALVFDESEVAQRVARMDAVTVSVAGRSREFHPVHLASGIALILLGVVFIVTQGTLDLATLYTEYGLSQAYEDINFALQDFFATSTGKLTAAALLAALVALVVAGARRVRSSS